VLFGCRQSFIQYNNYHALSVRWLRPKSPKMYMIQCCGANNSCVNLNPKKRPISTALNQQVKRRIDCIYHGNIVNLKFEVKEVEMHAILILILLPIIATACVVGLKTELPLSQNATYVIYRAIFHQTGTSAHKPNQKPQLI
jgi:hypothetical protein